MPIPKVLFQTSKDPMPEYVVEQIKTKLTSEWEYKHFNDAQIIEFFKQNPTDEFPNIIDKFHSFKKGCTKGDIFRYYYLWVKGGFTLDSDAMIKQNIETIVKDYDFFSVNSSCHPGTIFAGILGACPKNPVIYHVLDHIYNVDVDAIDAHPHLTCEEMYKAIICGGYSHNYKLYREWREDQNGDKIYNDDGEIIFMHYPFSKVIPRITA